MTTLTKLLEQAEKAEGPDRELDVAIAIVLRVPHPKLLRATTLSDWRPIEELPGTIQTYWPNGYTAASWLSQKYTSSLDAAIALTEALLPGWSYGIDVTQLTYPNRAWVGCPEQVSYDDEIVWQAEHMASTSLALIAATIKAKLAQQEKPDEQAG